MPTINCILPDKTEIIVNLSTSDKDVADLRLQLLLQHKLFFNTVAAKISKNDKILAEFKQDTDDIHIHNGSDHYYLLSDSFYWNSQHFANKYLYYNFAEQLVNITVLPENKEVYYFQEPIKIEMSVFPKTTQYEFVKQFNEKLFLLIPGKRILKTYLSNLSFGSIPINLLIRAFRSQGLTVCANILNESSIRLYLKYVGVFNSNSTEPCVECITHKNNTVDALRIYLSGEKFENKDKRLIKLKEFSKDQVIDELNLPMGSVLNYEILIQPDAQECTIEELNKISRNLIDEFLEISSEKNKQYINAYDVLWDYKLIANEIEYKINTTLLALQSNEDGLFYKLLSCHNSNFRYKESDSNVILLDFNHHLFDKCDKNLLHEALEIVIKRSYQISCTPNITPQLLEVLLSFVKYFNLTYDTQLETLLQSDYIQQLLKLSSRLESSSTFVLPLDC